MRSPIGFILSHAITHVPAQDGLVTPVTGKGYGTELTGPPLPTQQYREKPHHQPVSPAHC